MPVGHAQTSLAKRKKRKEFVVAVSSILVTSLESSNSDPKGKFDAKTLRWQHANKLFVDACWTESIDWGVAIMTSLAKSKMKAPWQEWLSDLKQSDFIFAGNSKIRFSNTTANWKAPSKIHYFALRSSLHALTGFSFCHAWVFSRKDPVMDMRLTIHTSSQILAIISYRSQLHSRQFCFICTKPGDRVLPVSDRSRYFKNDVGVCEWMNWEQVS